MNVHRALATLGFVLALTLRFSPASATVVAEDVADVARHAPGEEIVAWVRFTDRAGAERAPGALDAERARRPTKSLERRSLRGTGEARGITVDDLPVHEPYVRALAARGLAVRGTSRWMNAASVKGPAGVIAALARLPFVAAIEPVARARAPRPVEPFVEAKAVDVSTHAGPAPDAVLAPGDPAFYGPTWKQLAMMNAPAAHAAGLSGAGVLVCVLDSGFRTTHEVYAGLSVVARRDFIHGDTNVDDEVGQDPAGAGSHGTLTLASIGGFKEGKYVGGAYGATFALGKTEVFATETPVEMDYWQFGAEWADSLGADVISSSLGYFEFDSPFPSYGPLDMDGVTTTVTRAASMAMRRGMVVVTAVGNERGSAWNYLIAPSDADTVIAVGAVDSMNVLAPFSSPGPTADGRIKPDVVAMGRSVWVPSFSNPTGYGRVSGTSLSTPLTAAMAALVLEAHPSWDPFTVREALRETAGDPATPDNDIGWGLVNVQGALAFTPTVAVEPIPSADATGFALAAGPNPFRRGEGAVVRFTAPGRSVVDVFDARGRHVARLFEGDARSGAAATWSAGGAAPGVYWLRLAAAAGQVPVARALRVVVTP